MVLDLLYNDLRVRGGAGLAQVLGVHEAVRVAGDAFRAVLYRAGMAQYTPKISGKTSRNFNELNSIPYSGRRRVSAPRSGVSRAWRKCDRRWRSEPVRWYQRALSRRSALRRASGP